MKKKIEKVKNDLRQLRMLTHHIECALKAKNRHEKRLEHLKETDGKDKEIAKLLSVITSLNIVKSIEEATKLELEYMNLINQLEPIDKAIIIDGYINGEPYWKIAQKLGYSEAGIQKRALIAIEYIARHK